MTSIDNLEALNRFKLNPPKTPTYIEPELTQKQKIYWQFIEKSNLNIAITFPFKKSYRPNPFNGSKDSRMRQIPIEIIESSATGFVHSINKDLYGKNIKYNSIKLFMVRQREKGSHYHYHAFAGRPIDAITDYGKEMSVDDKTYINYLIQKWNKGSLHDPAFLSDRIADSGWLTYITRHNEDFCSKTSRFGK